MVFVLMLIYHDRIRKTGHLKTGAFNTFIPKPTRRLLELLATSVVALQVLPIKQP